MPVAPVVSPPQSENAINANYPGKELGFKPIEVPALPISADQQAQLSALDAQYFADQISPEEYHKKRAEILNIPDAFNH